MSKKHKYSVVFGLTLFTLPACKQRFSYKKKPVVQMQEVSGALVSLGAKYSDIPQPLGVTFVNTPRVYPVTQSHEDSSAFKIDAVSAQPIDGVRSAYEHEMERLGWQELARFQDENEVTLLYDKPLRLCIISLSSRSNSRESTAIVMRLANKNI